MVVLVSLDGADRSTNAGVCFSLLRCKRLHVGRDVRATAVIHRGIRVHRYGTHCPSPTAAAASACSCPSRMTCTPLISSGRAKAGPTERQLEKTRCATVLTCGRSRWDLAFAESMQAPSFHPLMDLEVCDGQLRARTSSPLQHTDHGERQERPTHAYR